MYKIVLISVLMIFLISGCAHEEEKPVQETETYAEAVSAFYLSLGAIETDQALFAFNKMNDVASMYPEEPAAWANLGVYAMRQGNYELAADRLSKAREIAPGNADILFLSALLENNRGDIEQSIEYLREASEANPSDLKIKYMLAKQLEREDDEGNISGIEKLLEDMLEQQPENQLLILDLIRLSAKQGDEEKTDDYLNELANFTDSWSEGARSQFRSVRESAEEGDLPALSIELALLRNELNVLPQFRVYVRELELPPNQVGFLIREFLKLPAPEMRAAAPDSAMSFTRGQPEKVEQTAVQMIKSVILLEDVPPLMAVVENGRVIIDNEAEMPFPGSSDKRLNQNSIAQIDYNYNFLNDIALAGEGGFRLYRQEDDFSFTDVTRRTNLPASLRNGSYNGVWSVDIDVDGDLDIVLAPYEETPVVLRNNGDETFTEISLFDGVQSVTEFHWVDFDGDGDPDAAFLDQSGNMYLFENLRSGVMKAVENIPHSEDVAALIYADLNADSYLDLIILKQDGSVHMLYSRPEFTGWQSELLIESSGLTGLNGKVNSSLFIQDMDNNGRLDLILSLPSETVIWLGEDEAGYQRLPAELPGIITSVVDIDGDERLDLLGFSEDMQPFQLINSGTLDYNARSIRARASGTAGDQRINSFGIGGEMEVRSGLLYQKQPINSPIVHFGLGNHEDTDMLRIIWPNGSVQAEFAELGIGSTIFNEQILKGSCPWLFTHNGDEHVFVTDLIWRSPLGLRINAQETAGVIQTEDRVRVPGNMLKPKNGVYDLRITAELWETHFFDMIKLVAVDHPEGTDLFIDERFAFPPPDLSFKITGEPRPVERVLDESGIDRTDLIREIDQNYLHAFQKSKYQGLTEEHSIEVVLGDEAPESGPLWLLAHGWVRPTDSSINLALSQGSNNLPKGIHVEIPDKNGEWTTAYPDIGFPAGKTKTVMIDLEDVFPEPSDRRVKLTTSTETYWDAIRWAEGKPGATYTETELNPVKMQLAYRGYSEWIKEDEYSPELPDYSVITSTTPRWQDLIGYYTRFGDVSELLNIIDDRYVIMNAGDELQLEFESLEPPAEGYVRNFVLIADGWVKDGDFNTGHSKTVRPLPTHSQTDDDYFELNYERLQDDPVYQKHKQDWVDYHTRYITPELFRTALNFK